MPFPNTVGPTRNQEERGMYVGPWHHAYLEAGPFPQNGIPERGNYGRLSVGPWSPESSDAFGSPEPEPQNNFGPWQPGWSPVSPNAYGIRGIRTGPWSPESSEAYGISQGEMTVSNLTTADKAALIAGGVLILVAIIGREHFGKH